MSNINFSRVWKNQISDVLSNGFLVSPRGSKTLELPQYTLTINMRRPVLNIPERKLNYKFMAAEAYWILTGNDRVDAISPFNKNIAQYSDDGEIFFGAYGPRIQSQMDYIVRALTNDPMTRQAVLTLWRQNPPKSKDIPCTISMVFSIRDFKLNCHVFMRSSDIWLGIPYDVFTFSMVAHKVCTLLKGAPIIPGKLYLTAASSHLYEQHWSSASDITKLKVFSNQSKTPSDMYTHLTKLMDTLSDLRYSRPGDDIRWWEKIT